MANFPCWLKGKDKAIAEALIKRDFHYCGLDNFHILYNNEIGTGYEIKKCLGWQIASAYGEVAIQAVREGAIFGKCLEIEKATDFEKEIRLTQNAITCAAKQWQRQGNLYIQLTLPIGEENDFREAI